MMTVERDRPMLQRQAAEALFAKDAPPSTAPARAIPSETEPQKKRLFTITRAYGAQRQSAFEHRERLKEAAGLIPGFFQFRQWCLEDVKNAWRDDREQATRQAKNRRVAWLHLFKHFARLHKIDRELEIRALDRQGNYSCELVERAEPDRWGRLVRLAGAFGIGERDLLALAERSPSTQTELNHEPRERTQA